MKDGEEKSDNVQLIRADDYANALTGLGGPPDKSSYTFIQQYRRLGFEELAVVYESDAIAARVVDRLVDDGVREGFTLKGVNEDFDFSSVLSELEDLDALNALADGWRWGRLFGGAIVVLAVNDGRPFDKPLDMSNITGISGLQVVEAPFVQPEGYISGLGSRAFSLPDHYNITLPFGSQKRKKIHRSRVIRFDGMRVPASRRLRYAGWAPSVIQRIATELFQLGEVMGYARTIIHDISIMVLSMEGLKEQLCGDVNDQATLKRLLENIRLVVDNLHVLALDSKDSYEEVKRDVGGLEKMIDKFVDAIVRATDMPRTVLLGEQPGGINSNADSEIRAWYDFVHSQQRMVLTPAINRFLKVMFAIRRKRGERVPTEWTIEYNQLWQPTESDKAETQLVTAQKDQIYVGLGVLTPAMIQKRLVSEGEIESTDVTPAPVEPAAVEGEVVVAEDDELAQPSEAPVPPDLVSVREAAQKVNVPTRTLSRLMELGQLEFWQFGSRKQVSMAEVANIGRPVPPEPDLETEGAEV